MKTRSSNGHPLTDRKAIPLSSSRAHWSSKDEAALITFFSDQKCKSGNVVFKMSTFRDAAAVVNALRVKGGEKSAESCKTKWIRLKRLHEIVNTLKSNPGFTWDDEKGMNIQKENEAEWEVLCSGNNGFRQFATKGWPHCAAMDQLLSSKAKATLTPGQLSSSAPVDILSSNSFPLSKRELSYDISTQSSTSSEGSSEGENDGIRLINEMADMLRAIAGLKKPLGPFAAAAAAAAAPEDKLPRVVPPGEAATELFLKNYRLSKERGDEWLSLVDVFRMTDIFRVDENIARRYSLFHKKSGELMTRKWIQIQLMERRDHS